MDVLVGSFILALGAAAFFSMMPVVSRSEHLAREESVATQIAQRMVEHVQLLKTSDLNATTLTSLNLIESGQTASPYSFSQSPLDQGSDYSASTALKNGQGVLSVEDIGTNSKKVTVTVTWTSASGKTRSITTGTVVGGYR